MDKFYEQFITKDYGKSSEFIKYLSVIFLLLSLFFFMFFMFFSIVCILVFIVLRIYIHLKFVEYEYEYFQDELVISKILNKSSRKVLGTIKVSQVYKVYKPNDENLKGLKICKAYLKGALHTQGNKEVIIVTSSEKLKGFYLSLDEKLLEILRTQNQNFFNYI